MYTSEDYITFIELERFDKISNEGLRLIAEKFREYEKQNKHLTDQLMNMKNNKTKKWFP